MAPPVLRELPQHTAESEPEGAQVSLDEPGSRYRWRVKDCRIGSWYQLSDVYSVHEMWCLLRQGRFSHARRVE